LDTKRGRPAPQPERAEQGSATPQADSAPASAAPVEVGTPPSSPAADEGPAAGASTEPSSPAVPDGVGSPLAVGAAAAAAKDALQNEAADQPGAGDTAQAGTVPCGMARADEAPTAQPQVFSLPLEAQDAGEQKDTNPGGGGEAYGLGKAGKTADAAAGPSPAAVASHASANEAAAPAPGLGELPGVVTLAHQGPSPAGGEAPGAAATIARPAAEHAGASLVIGTLEPGTDGPQTNVARVVRGLYAAASAGGGAVTLRLSPPEMGLVRVELELQQGVVRAKLLAQQETARDLLGQRVGELRQALERQGLVVERLHVDSLPSLPAGRAETEDAGRQPRQPSDGYGGGGGGQSQDGGRSPEERTGGRRSFEAELLNMVA